MLTITDTTLSAINPSKAPEGSIKEFYNVLLALGIDYVEVSPAILPFLGRDFDPARVIIRKDFYLSHGEIKIAEITANTLSANHGKVPEPYRQYDELRAIGEESLLLADYCSVFSEILKFASLPISFCTKHAGYAATALMTEWVLAGGNQVACSFMGTGGHAPLEEVLLSLEVNGYALSNIDVARLQPLGALWQTLTGGTIPTKKPVVGEKIFEVESGIHIDGIMKNRMNFEPFPPEKVGAKRAFLLGKSSGRSALIMKLRELKIMENVNDLDWILHLVREMSIAENRSIRDTELYSLIRNIRGSRACI